MSDTSIDDLVDEIEQTHHTFTRSELARLEPLLHEVLRAHGDRHTELVDVAETFVRLADELEPHMHKEEVILFPAIVRALGDGASADFIQHPIRVMRREHVHVLDLLRQLRERTGNYKAPEDACTSYVSLFVGLEALDVDLVQHIKREDEELFPRALSLGQH